MRFNLTGRALSLLRYEPNLPEIQTCSALLFLLLAVSLNGCRTSPGGSDLNGSAALTTPETRDLLSTQSHGLDEESFKVSFLGSAIITDVSQLVDLGGGLYQFVQSDAGGSCTVTFDFGTDFKSSKVVAGKTILGVPGSVTLTDTSDATATAADVVVGKTAYAGGSKLVGSLSPLSGVTDTVSNSSLAQSVGSGVATFAPSAGTAYVSFVVDLGLGWVAANFCSGVTIFGLNGSAPCGLGFGSGPSTVFSRTHFASSILPDGRVLLAGGTLPDSSYTKSASVCNLDGTCAATGDLVDFRNFHSAVLLYSGKVLIAGGYNNSGSLKTAELYNPTAGTFSSTGDTVYFHDHANFVTLGDGRVLVTGGGASGSDEAEIYDPMAGSFTATTGSMIVARDNHRMTLLPNGKVLISGGSPGGPLDSTEIFNPATQTFSVGPTMSEGRSGHVSILLPENKVLLAGGGSAVASADLYDPALNTMSVTGSMAVGSYDHQAVLLSNGKVLVTGGSAASALSRSEIYDPVAGSFGAGSNMIAARSGHTMDKTVEGRIFITNGASGTTTEIFQ